MTVCTDYSPTFHQTDPSRVPRSSCHCSQPLSPLPPLPATSRPTTSDLRSSSSTPAALDAGASNHKPMCRSAISVSECSAVSSRRCVPTEIRDTTLLAQDGLQPQALQVIGMLRVQGGGERESCFLVLHSESTVEGAACRPRNNQRHNTGGSTPLTLVAQSCSDTARTHPQDPRKPNSAQWARRLRRRSRRRRD